MIKYRTYQRQDGEEMARLFRETVEIVNAADYTKEQRQAWAGTNPDPVLWHEKFAKTDTIVAEDNGKILGFGNMDADGYLDMLYVHYAYQKMGIAREICAKLEAGCGAERFSVHASITAAPFFEKQGYQIQKRQQVERKGVVLENYKMEKYKK